MAINDSSNTVISVFIFTVSSNMADAWTKASVMLPPMTGTLCDIIHRNNIMALLKVGFR